MIGKTHRYSHCIITLALAVTALLLLAAWQNAQPAQATTGGSAPRHTSCRAQTCTAVAALDLGGPLSGTVGQEYRFTATAGPPTATLPVTYTWLASGQSAVVTTTNALSHTVAFTWTTAGVKTITVTAANCGGAVSRTHTITLEQITLYLPLVMRSWPPPSWHFQCVDCPPAVGALTQHSAVVDSQGRLHIAYGGDRLYHAWREGDTWQIETADPGPDVGQGASITLDGDDHPHIAYRNGAFTTLYYAHWDGSQWLTTTVPINFGTGRLRHTSIALDSANRPYIAYVVHSDISVYAIRYVYWDGSQWQDQEIESDIAYWATWDLTLAMDSADRLHLGYARDTGPERQESLIHAYWDGSQWQSETAVSGKFGDHAMALDSSGMPRFVYTAFDENGDSLVKYTYWDGSQWQSEVAVPPGEAGGADGISLVLDASDAPYVGYHDLRDENITFVHYDGSAWQREVAAAQQSISNDATALAVDEAGQPHLIYRLDDSTLRHVYRQGSEWQGESVTQGGSPGSSSSLALDSAGRPGIAYYDEVRDELRYAHWDGAAWQIQVVDTVPSTGLVDAVSLAIDQADRPHITYNEYDIVRYAFWDGAAWQIETVDSPLRSNGEALALDSSGQPHVAYYAYDTISKKWYVRYASRSGGNWQIETVDTVGYVLMDTSLALDSADRPHIAYYDSTGADLKYARWDGAAWQVETVDSEDSGAYRSLALDGADRPHISYFDNTNDDLKYARWDGSAWLTETVESAGQTGYSNSLAVDADGHPHIIYLNWDSTGYLLRYAHWDGTQWQIETVVDGWVEWYPSLALDAAGRPHISYYDGGWNDLWYAWWGP